MKSGIGILFKNLILATLTIVIVLHFPASNVEARGKRNEAMVRAAVVLGILRFTYWSESNQPKDTIMMCELGKSRVADAFRGLGKIPKIGKLAVKVNSIKKEEMINQCHALIVGENALSADIKDKHVLVICDNCDKAYQRESAIALRLKNNVIRFDINLDKLDDQDISLSASVLELAAKCRSSNPEIRACND